jgi:sulfate transport system substrate-binding protein
MKPFFLSLSALVLALANPVAATAAEVTLLNVSYDPTREFYQDYNAAFAKYWLAKTGDKVLAWRLRQASPRHY